MRSAREIRRRERRRARPIRDAEGARPGEVRYENCWRVQWGHPVEEDHTTHRDVRKDPMHGRRERDALAQRRRVAARVQRRFHSDAGRRRAGRRQESCGTPYQENGEEHGQMLDPHNSLLAQRVPRTFHGTPISRSNPSRAGLGVGAERIPAKWPFRLPLGCRAGWPGPSYDSQPFPLRPGVWPCGQ